MKRVAIYACTLTLLLSVFVLPALADQMFYDDTIDLANWEHQYFVNNGGGVPYAEFTDEGGFGRVRIHLGGSPTNSYVLSAQINTSAVYDPITEGAIDSIDYSELARVWDTEFNTYGGATMLALEQNEQIYATGYQNIRETTATPPSPWYTITFSDLVASSFGLVFSNGVRDFSQNPDFSATGTQITFGFARNGSHTYSFGVDRYTDIDNWRVEITSTTPPPIPEPATMLLLGSGLIGLAGYRKRTRRS